MRRAASLAVVLIGSVLSAPAAHAAADTIDGGCVVAVADLHSVTNFATNGFLIDASVTRDDGGMPIGATVTCWIQVNGVESAGTRFASSGPGVQVGLNQVVFVLDQTDSVAVCERVAYADGTTTSSCAAPSEVGVPPQLIFDTIHSAFVAVDPVVCPVLAANSGNYPAGVGLSSTGDVVLTDPLDLLGTLVVYDCPPYGPQPKPDLVVFGPVRT